MSVMAVRVVTDSTSDISQADAARWGIEVVPLNIHFGTEQWVGPTDRHLEAGQVNDLRDGMIRDSSAESRKLRDITLHKRGAR